MDNNTEQVQFLPLCMCRNAYLKYDTVRAPCSANHVLRCYCFRKQRQSTSVVFFAITFSIPYGALCHGGPLQSIPQNIGQITKFIRAVQHFRGPIRRRYNAASPSEKQFKFRSLLRGHHTPQRVLRRVLTGCGNCAEARIFLHNAQTLPPAHAHSGQSFLMAPSIQLENAGVFAASENAWSRAVL